MGEEMGEMTDVPGRAGQAPRMTPPAVSHRQARGPHNLGPHKLAARSPQHPAREPKRQAEWACSGRSWCAGGVTAHGRSRCPRP